MTRSRSKDFAEFNPEPERIVSHRRKRDKHIVESSQSGASADVAEKEMAELVGDCADGRNREDVVVDPVENQAADNRNDQPRTNSDFARPNLSGVNSSIVRPPVNANNFELKPAVIQMVQQYAQFDGLQDEDPNSHVQAFLEICDTFKFNGVSDDAIRLRLFPFSLRGKAKQWLNSLPKCSIITWQDLIKKFMDKFFPPSKTAKLRAEIQSYHQYETETLYDTWERFKDSMRKCPHHGIPEWLQVQIFYNGLNYQTRQTVDAAAGGTLNHKTPEESLTLFEDMAANSYEWSHGRGREKRAAGVLEVNVATTIMSQVEALSRKIDGLTISQQQLAVVDPLGVEEAQAEHVDYLGNPIRPQNNPYSNTYNPGWRNHPNFSWSNNSNVQKGNLNPPPGYPRPQVQNPKPQIEDLLTKIIKDSDERQKSLDLILENQDTTLRNHEASIHNLETQVGQIAKLLSERSQGSLPGNTEPNPREHVKAVTLRSGKELQVGVQEKESQGTSVVKEPVILKEQGQHFEDSDKSKSTPQVVPEYKPNIPYPSRLRKDKADEHYGKFLEIFKQLHINLPLVEALSQMPRYAKFLKELLSNKRKLEEFSTVTLGGECSAVIQNKLPKKLKDPRSFTIPCLIGNLSEERALADLGASINLMPYKIFQKLGLGEPKPTRMSLQLADRSVKFPRGVVEDVLVKVQDFIFPADFVILDMEADVEVPLILGRPFLATARAIIDVGDGKLVLRVGNEEVIVKMPDVLKQSMHHDDTCFAIDYLDLAISDSLQSLLSDDSLEVCLLKGEEEETEDSAINTVINQLKNNPEWKKEKNFEEINRSSVQRSKPSIEEPPELELKQLPKYLQYAFLEENSKLPVIIASGLNQDQRDKLLHVLGQHKKAIAWKMEDIKGISPSFCTHKILMEDCVKPVVQPQRRLNPNMRDVVKKEVIKLLDAGMIYPISDSAWVSPVQVVPKKGSMTVVPNEKNELIPMRTVTGWRVCIDY